MRDTVPVLKGAGYFSGNTTDQISRPGPFLYVIIPFLHEGLAFAWEQSVGGFTNPQSTDDAIII